MLNKSKGPAVHSLRAQADKMNYSMEMRKTLQNTDHLTIRQAEVSEIITETTALENGKEIQKMTGVKTFQVRFIIVRQSYCVQELIFAQDV